MGSGPSDPKCPEVPLDKLIDLRSDTVTKPPEGMRRVMAEAEVGDELWDGDPTTDRLQETSARMFGKEKALFVPSGTMANLIALKAHTRPGEELICSDSAHVIHAEVAGLAVVAGLQSRPIPAPEGFFTGDQVADAIRPGDFWAPRTGLIEVENSMNASGGRIFPQRQIDDICALAHDRGVPVHMDGARIFNAAVASQTDVKRIARGCDSVCFCLSKGLGTPVGSMLLGTAAFIERAFGIRQMLGGGMRQTGILAAAGLYALEHNIERLAEDHANARLLAEGLAAIQGIRLNLESVETNMVYFDPSETGLPAGELVNRLDERGLLSHASGRASIRFVTHLDVDRGDILQALDIIRDVAGAVER
jgi:threonine aldolase